MLNSLQNELAYNSVPIAIGREQDAQYYYYDHGPLARTEIGQNNLQGYDYLYNLQGWMKGINAIDNANDPGKDGVGLNATLLCNIPISLNPISENANQ